MGMGGCAARCAPCGVRGGTLSTWARCALSAGCAATVVARHATTCPTLPGLRVFTHACDEALLLGSSRCGRAWWRWCVLTPLPHTRRDVSLRPQLEGVYGKFKHSASSFMPSQYGICLFEFDEGTATTPGRCVLLCCAGRAHPPTAKTAKPPPPPPDVRQTHALWLTAATWRTRSTSTYSRPPSRRRWTCPSLARCVPGRKSVAAAREHGFTLQCGSVCPPFPVPRLTALIPEVPVRQQVRLWQVCGQGRPLLVAAAGARHHPPQVRPVCARSRCCCCFLTTEPAPLLPCGVPQACTSARR